MEYAIWGTGIRGKLAADFIGIENISIFIDENEQIQHRKCFGKYVISFNEYLIKYSDCYIIVTPNDYSGIIEQLNEEGIEHYSLLKDIIY